VRARLTVGLVVASVAAMLQATSASAAPSVFATGTNGPETITKAATGGFLVTDVDGTVWGVAADGGSASSLATVPYSLRGGLVLPPTFGSLSGDFLVVGGDANVGGTAFASTMDSAFAITPYQTQPASLWTQPVLATRFGAHSGDVLVTNQGDGTGTFNGSVDFFAPDGSVGTVATLPAVNVPFGADLAPRSFGEFGDALLVSDAASGELSSVDATGHVRSFATVPLADGQSGLRQIAFAPRGWRGYSNLLFVSMDNGSINVVDRDGVVVGKIAGEFSPRGLLFTPISGSPALLFSDIATGRILKASPDDVTPIRD
jgi:hypothetical protein